MKKLSKRKEKRIVQTKVDATHLIACTSQFPHLSKFIYAFTKPHLHFKEL